ncbi:hypothetical protein K435DRAFT_867853 [Dendrothele bispora CBS 962.96]|uniref:Uncharacterized protein n=1 Tax=Dendrothele bispora (strain CBS 962.96) TaxID=1314807 RepID=A0A4S8LDN0_DENBC|nr:hypothetical protein K435DRAFT_867853 [Dendrothele bispora CBS 962.96]
MHNSSSRNEAEFDMSDDKLTIQQIKEGANLIHQYATLTKLHADRLITNMLSPQEMHIIRRHLGQVRHILLGGIPAPRRPPSQIQNHPPHSSTGLPTRNKLTAQMTGKPSRHDNGELLTNTNQRNLVEKGPAAGFGHP